MRIHHVGSGWFGRILYSRPRPRCGLGWRFANSKRLGSERHQEKIAAVGSEDGVPKLAIEGEPGEGDQY